MLPCSKSNEYKRLLNMNPSQWMFGELIEERHDIFAKSSARQLTLAIGPCGEVVYILSFCGPRSRTSTSESRRNSDGCRIVDHSQKVNTKGILISLFQLSQDRNRFPGHRRAKVF